MKTLVTFVSMLSFLIQPVSALAQVSPPTNMAAVSVREYFVANDQGRPLVTVHLLGGVATPGVYHIPIDTDLAQLIAYAGGAPATSDLSDITVRSQANGKYHVSQFNLENELKASKDLYRLHDHDIVQINQKYTPDRPMAWIGIVSAVASIALSAYLINDMSKR